MAQWDSSIALHGVSEQFHVVHTPFRFISHFKIRQRTKFHFAAIIVTSHRRKHAIDHADMKMDIGVETRAKNNRAIDIGGRIINSSANCRRRLEVMIFYAIFQIAGSANSFS